MLIYLMLTSFFLLMQGYLCVLPTDGNEGQIVINPKEMIIENNVS